MPITSEQQLYSDFSKNVQKLISAKKQLNKHINECIRKNDTNGLWVNTHLYAMLYFSWTEAMLVKLVHSPKAFPLSYKQQIFQKRDIIDKWKKMIDISFSKFTVQGGETPNKKRDLNRLVDVYLKDQARIRNKIAHGQWVFPLIKSCLKPDDEAKIFLETIDVVQIDLWFSIFEQFAEIIQGLVDSRAYNGHKAHYNQYYLRVVKIQEIIKERSTFTMEKKRELLMQKASFRKNPGSIVASQTVAIRPIPTSAQSS